MRITRLLVLVVVGFLGCGDDQEPDIWIDVVVTPSNCAMPSGVYQVTYSNFTGDDCGLVASTKVVDIDEPVTGICSASPRWERCTMYVSTTCADNNNGGVKSTLTGAVRWSSDASTGTGKLTVAYTLPDGECTSSYDVSYERPPSTTSQW